MSAASLTDQQLLAELERRGLMPRCRCQRWRTYLGWDRTFHCGGCRKTITECTCR